MFSRGLEKGAVVLGAGAGVGRALATELAKNGYSLVLAGRDVRDLNALASHLTHVFSVCCTVAILDLESKDLDGETFFNVCSKSILSLDALFITAGATDLCDDGMSSPSVNQRLVQTNFLGVAQVVAVFVAKFKKVNRGNIIVFSSIATGRPRKRNVMYTAAKMALESYCRSIQHALADSKVKVKIYALGYVDTAMIYGQKLLFPTVSAQAVASLVVKDLDRGGRFQYFPNFWIVIVALLRCLPWAIFKRLSF